MLGAIIGDIAGSRFEWHNIKTKEFDFFTDKCRPTDDSVMSAAVAKAILACEGDYSGFGGECVKCMQEIGRLYPHAGYGGTFRLWLKTDNPEPYNSWGNGSAMRVSACGFAAESLEEALELAKKSAEVTHNHPEGIKGAQAAAAAIYLAKTKHSMDEIRKYITDNFYKIDFTLDEIRPHYNFDVSCQGSVPQALEAFFESTDFEDAIRDAISIGGDSDTIAAVTGGIAEAYYGIPSEIRNKALGFLDEKLISVIEAFESKFGAY